MLHHIEKSCEVLVVVYSGVEQVYSFLVLLQFIPYFHTSVPCLLTGLFWLLVLPVGKYFFQVRNSEL